MKWFLVLLIVANIVFFAWQQSGEDPDSNAVPAVERQPGGQGNRLELLSESNTQASRQSEAPDKAADAARAEPLCWLLGPLPEVITAKQVLMRFQKQGVSAELQEIEVTTGLDYLLYIGPFASRDEGLTRLRELHGSGVDSFLITRGTLNNAISLGLFSSVRQAEAALANFAEQGYEANIRENERTGLQQWLVVPMAEADGLDVGFWDELNIDFSGLERKQNWCKSIAPVDGIE